MNGLMQHFPESNLYGVNRKDAWNIYLELKLG